MNDEIKEKLRAAIGPIMVLIEQAKEDHPDSTIKLMIAAEHTDGGGKIVARMDTDEFLHDVAMLVGYTEPTTDDRVAALMGKLGLL